MSDSFENLRRERSPLDGTSASPSEHPELAVDGFRQTAAGGSSAGNPLLNPYQSAGSLPDDELEIEEPLDRSYPSLLRTCIRWTVVCSIAAAPSFVVGFQSVTQHRIAGMLAAVVSFIVLYIAADLLTRRWPIRRSLVVRRTLVTVYVLRLIASVIFPIGLMVDVPTGLIAVTITTGLHGGESTSTFNDFTSSSAGSELAAFWLAYRITCVHAVLMNFFLCVSGLLLFPVVWAIVTRMGSSPSTLPAAIPFSPPLPPINDSNPFSSLNR